MIMLDSFDGRAYVYDTKTGTLLHTFDNPTPADGDRFGIRLAMDGDYAVIGAWSDDTLVDHTGAAYIYHMETGELIHTVDNPEPANADHFGYDIAAAGGYTAIAAADDDDPFGDSGSVYIFDILSGNLIHTIRNPSPNTGDDFGHSVGMSDEYVVISAPYDDTTGTNHGRVYVFDVTTGSLIYTFDNPDPDDSDRFGLRADVSGHYALIAAYEDDVAASNAGAVYIYDLRNGSHIQTLLYQNDASASDGFGINLAIHNNHIAVGANLDDQPSATDAGSAYLYKITDDDTVSYENATTALTVNLSDQTVAGPNTQLFSEDFTDLSSTGWTGATVDNSDPGFGAILGVCLARMDHRLSIKHIRLALRKL